MTAFYNENDPHAAAWLREIIRQGHIAPGVVDERSIREIDPADLVGFAQVHLFAGIGVWSYALRLAGWPDDRPVWTGSCPCQPFSAAGKRKGTTDDRHLWPEMFRLVSACRPELCLGEQVASKDGLAWLDSVFSDLEDADYACGAVDTCAAGFGAPHIRQRLYWMANSMPAGRTEGRAEPGDGSASGSCEPERLAYLHGHGCNQKRVRVPPTGQDGFVGDCPSCGLADSKCYGQDASEERGSLEASKSQRRMLKSSRVCASSWSDAVFLSCRDGKARPTQPGIFPLAHGAPARVVRLRGYGNAIVAPQAAAFIQAVAEII